MNKMNVPACRECNHFNESPDEMFSTCAFYQYEDVNYFDGKVTKHNSLAFSMRKSEDHCGRGGKDFERREEVPSYCCQGCGEQVGWVGRFFQWIRLPFHKCGDHDTL